MKGQGLVFKAPALLAMMSAALIATAQGQVPKPRTSEQKTVARERFVDNKNGTVTDTKTGLMWATKDNGSNITWGDAKKYCENYRGAGYSDWRMATLDELSSLYDGYSGGQISDCAPTAGVIFVVKEIKLSCHSVWANRERVTPAQTDPMFYFGFNGRGNYAVHGYSGTDINVRALPVRTVKK